MIYRFKLKMLFCLFSLLKNKARIRLYRPIFDMIIKELVPHNNSHHVHPHFSRESPPHFSFPPTPQTSCPFQCLHDRPLRHPPRFSYQPICASPPLHREKPHHDRRSPHFRLYRDRETRFFTPLRRQTTMYCRSLFFAF